MALGALLTREMGVEILVNIIHEGGDRGVYPSVGRHKHIVKISLCPEVVPTAEVNNGGKEIHNSHEIPVFGESA